MDVFFFFSFLSLLWKCILMRFFFSWMESHEKEFAGLAGCPNLCDGGLTCLFGCLNVASLKQRTDRGRKHSRTAPSVVAYQHVKLTHPALKGSSTQS